jgi:hypothetical protein
MGVQQFVAGALRTSLAAFDAEDVTISGETAQGVLSEITLASDLMEAGPSNLRTLKAVFPAGAFSAPVKIGSRATARGQTWKVADIASGAAVYEITLENPSRRE